MSKGLLNKVLISTRPAGQNRELQTLLTSEGAQLIEMPTIEIRASELTDEMEEQLSRISQYSWIIFVSPNSVRYFFDKLSKVNGSYELPEFIKLATVGRKTNDLLSGFGHQSTIKNPGTTAEDLLVELQKVVTAEDAILFPEGNIARGIIASNLAAIASCENIVVYENSKPVVINDEALNMIIQNKYDGIILTSPSGFDNLRSLLGKKFDLKKLKLFCIGSTTASAVSKAGLLPLAVAEMTSATGIVEAIKSKFINQ